MTIATAGHAVAPALPKWGYILIAGVATALAWRDHGAVLAAERRISSDVNR